MSFWKFEGSGFGSRKRKAEGAGAQAPDPVEPHEAAILNILRTEVIGKLTLNEAKGPSVGLALISLVHIASVLMGRATKPQEYDLSHSPKFESVLGEFDDALKKAGIKDTEARNTIDNRVVDIISTSLRSHLAQAVAAQTADTPPATVGAPSILNRKRYTPEPDVALIISADQVGNAIKRAREVSQTLVFTDAVPESRFETALKELAEARAKMLGVRPSHAVEYADTAFGKRRQVIDLLNAIKPDSQQTNENVLVRDIISAMDDAMGRKRQA